MTNAKTTTRDLLLLEAGSKEISISDIYEPFSRRRQQAEKLVKEGVFKKRTTGFQYTTYYSFA